MIFSVSTMTCDGCVRSITRLVQAADPKATVSADLASRRVSLTTALSGVAVKALLDKAGYEATELPS
ncbi:heavy-metal-associated domain-containing protein [Elioraea sp.]|uniref:heavy-metal-associated domain-containing protein n=1 Tax=Elioraea sp. TaxID=2185103 RepID=UPI003F71727F